MLADDSLEKETCLLKTGYDSFQGFATTFIVNQMVENNGVFPREAISTLCRLAWWSEKGDTGPIYKRGYGEAPRFQCIHLQLKARIWGILESLIRASLV